MLYLLLASILTAIILYAMMYVTHLITLLTINFDIFNNPEYGMALYEILTVIVVAIAWLPGAYILRHHKIPHVFTTAIFAFMAALGFAVLAAPFTYRLRILGGFDSMVATYFVSIFLAYIFGDALFNVASFRWFYKILLGIITIISTYTLIAVRFLA